MIRIHSMKIYKYLNELNATEKRNYYPISNINNNDINNSYNNLKRNINELTPIRKSFNDTNIIDYNFYGSPNNENKNKPVESYYINKNEKNSKTLNRSSSFFHPKAVIKSYLSMNDEEKKNEKENKINNKKEYIYYEKKNLYNNDDNKKLNMKDNSLKMNLLKNKFLYNYNNNEFE